MTNFSQEGNSWSDSYTWSFLHSEWQHGPPNRQKIQARLHGGRHCKVPHPLPSTRVCSQVYFEGKIIDRSKGKLSYRYMRSSTCWIIFLSIDVARAVLVTLWVEIDKEIIECKDSDRRNYVTRYEVFMVFLVWKQVQFIFIQENKCAWIGWSE